MFDLRLAARSLGKTPAFTALVVLILALGVGANATLFSIADAVLFRPFPFIDQDRLVIGGKNATAPRSEISYRDYLAWRARSRAFDDLAVLGSTNWTLHLRLRDDTIAIRHRAVSANFFRVLGVTPMLGRTFDASEDRRGAAPTIVLSHGLWQRQFGGDPSAIGRFLTLNDRSFTVVGVMPPDFQYPSDADAWTPVVTELAAIPAAAPFGRLEDSDVGVLYIVGRLKPQMTIAAARADLNRVVEQESRGAGRADRAESSLTPLVDDILGPAPRGLWILMGAVALLLLVACANAAGLLLVRSAGRRHEFVVRRALGATRAALARQLFCESVLLAVLAVGAALLASLVCVPLVRFAIPGELPRLANASITGRTLAFTFATGLTAAVVSWIVPALQTGRDLDAAIRRGGRTIVAASLRQPLRRALIVGELAAAVVLLTAAGLMFRSVLRLAHLDLGFEANHLLAVSASSHSAATTNAAMRQQADRTLHELAAIPGIVSVAGVSTRPLFGAVGNDSPFVLEEQSRQAAASNPFVNTETVTPSYFSTLRKRLVRGRLFTDDDRATTERVVIVSQGFAEWAWPGGDAIGKRIQVAALGRGAPVWWRVVGVVVDSRNREITAPRFDVYASSAQSQDTIETFLVRSVGADEGVVGAIRQRLRELDPHGIVSVEAMEDVIASHEAPWRANLALFAAFALLTGFIAVTGLYAMMAFSVIEQTREIGVRLVLGASPTRVAGGIVRTASSLIGEGALVGIVGAAMTTRLMRSLLFEIQPLDPAALAISPLILAGVALVACALPAIRAAHVDPSICLRAE